ncbi:hypothetical protein [Streptomyces candidus]|uniref:hypothetical protein n=1 Tax=Streptomyces candidus TaxID=67283 RepID=UPI001618DD12|nr:hypothetical protein [Streptomyces candidus]
MIWTRPVTEVAGRHVKRYLVAADRTALTPAVEEAAYAILPELLPEPDGTPPATFVVLHKGGDSGAYLNAYSWTWDNALYFGGAAAGQPALGCPDEDPTHFVVLDRSLIGCVWELPPLLHERDAWVRHMLDPHPPSPSGLPARLDAYLADVMPGRTTGDRL